MASRFQKYDGVEARIESGEVDFAAGRRAFLATVAAGTLGATAVASTGGALAQAAGPTATDVFNFALNLEYLEAEFYVRAAFNRPLSELVGVDGQGSLGGVTGGRGVDFGSENNIRNYARELANDETAHVRYLRNILGSARVARPNIDFVNSFNALARAAGLVPATGTFDAFASPNNFLIASYVFEDVGVSAYKGATPLLRNNEFLEGAAGLLAAEAYHAGLVRTILTARGLFAAGDRISDLRDVLDGAGDTDQGLSFDGDGALGNILPADGNSLPFSRTPGQVLNIVYASTSGQAGGFFPSGLNGAVR